MAKWNYNEQTPETRRKLIIATAVLAAVLAVAILVSLSWGAVAKYIYKNQREGVVRAQAFYFTSDLLTDDGKAEYRLNYYADQVEFTLRNYDGLLDSELDIKYNIKVEQLITADGETVTASPDKGTIRVDDREVTIRLEGMKPGGQYRVTVTGKGGYKKTLSATFTVSADTTGVYKNTAIYDDYVLLTVWTKNQSAAVNITIPGGLIPDGTDSVLTGKAAGDSLELPLGENASRAYRFFIGQGYTGGEIPVTCGGLPVPEAELN